MRKEAELDEEKGKNALVDKKNETRGLHRGSKRKKMVRLLDAPQNSFIGELIPIITFDYLFCSFHF